VVIVGFTGLAIDVSYLQWQKGRIQAAADAAAMGALRELELSQTDLTAAGQNDAALNGFTDGQDSTYVTVNNPPTLGSYAGNSAAVETVVTRTVPTFFMRVFGQSGVTISARAVARTTSAQGSIGGCIFALNPSASSALWFSGTENTTTSCGAVVNSNNASALEVSGTAAVNLANSAKIGVVGPGTAGQGWTLNGGGTITNTITGAAESPVNIQPFGDPLTNVPAPTLSTVTGGIQSSSAMVVNGTRTLNPGIYCGGLTLHGNVTFNPGIYVLAGGGMQTNAQAVVSGTNVMFYNTTGSAWGCGAVAASSIFFNGGAQVNLTAPTNQSPIGVLLFEDRSVSGLTNTINGNSSSTFNGALYFRNSALMFAGTSTASRGYLVIVADTIKIVGTSNLGNDYTDLANVYTIAPGSTGGGLVE